MASNIVILEYHNCILCIHLTDGLVDDLGLYNISTERVKNVYIGKVKNIVKNIGAAFVDIAPGMSCYLNLEECKDLLVLNRKREQVDLRQGDEVLVQLIKGAVKSKNPVCSGRLRLPADIKNEILKIAPTRSVFSVLYSATPEYIDFIKRQNLDVVEKISCASESIYDEVMGNITQRDRDKVCLYSDTFPIDKLYKIDTLIEELTNKRIWLKSGANIVIEYTEAMTVIDVNTAKSIRDKSENHILDTNLEAAEEILRQIRLRSLSGMILVDFINDNGANTDLLFNKLKDMVAKEAIKTELIDITGLGIIEITRSKKYPPIHETIKNINTKNS